MDRCAAVQSVAGMRVTKPVRRNREIDAGAARSLTDDSQDGHGLQRTATFTGPEHRVAVARLATELSQFFPHRRGQLDGSGPIALTENRDLAAVAVGLEVPPAQAA